MKGASILIVEDESIIALNLKETLLELGYRVCGIAPGKEKALRLLEREVPQLILMDISLKDGDNGIALAETITAAYPVPVVFLTAHAEPGTIAEAGRSAPFGYLVKPFDAATLHATIEVAIERFRHERARHEALDAAERVNRTLSVRLETEHAAGARTVRLRYGYLFDRETQTLYCGDERVRLTARETQVVALLCAEPGIVPSERIEQAVWPDEPAGYAALRSLLFRLRGKLAEGLITNVSGLGYKIERP